jgi:CHAT domain-containing protein
VAARLAGELADELIRPVEKVIAGARRLYVAPGGSLTLLPFAVLPLDGSALGERFVLSLLPAAALLTRPGAGLPPRRDAPALLVGDPAYDRWPRLPGTGVEVGHIAAPRGTVLIGTSATFARVAELAPAAGIVHLATHGFVDELRPYLSRLALAGGDELTVPGLLELGLSADLLVLSACHTGRGRATAAGDVLGLARAALSAGVRHLVVSLWPVDDVSACLTMVALHDRLQHGDDVATALRAAQARVRPTKPGQRSDEYAALAGTPPVNRIRDVLATGGEEHVNPIAHWAPFVHIGV